MIIIDKILENLNHFGLIGDCIKWILKIIDGNPVAIMILFFIVFFVIIFNNSVITKKSAYKRY
jgi:hypothetical protein